MFISVLASNQGGCGGFFTSLLSGCEFLPAQTISFSRPSLMKPWMLRARKVSPSLWAYPSADWRLNGIAHSPLLRWKKMLRFSFVLWIHFTAVLISTVERVFFQENFCKEEINIFEEMNDREAKQVSRSKEFWRSILSWPRVHVLRICIYTWCINTCTCWGWYLHHVDTHLRLQVIRWKLPTQPVSSRNK